MKTMQLNWKRSLAMFALLAAFNGPEAPVAVAQSDQPESPPAAAPAVAPDGAPLAAPADAGTNSEAIEAPSAPKLPPPPAGAADVFSKRLAKFGETAAKSPSGAKLEAKLNQIVLPEVSFDNLPLGEVLRFLSDESVKRDPEKTGVNFLINPNVRPVARAGAVNPATGLPLAAPAEQFDVAAVSVEFNLPLRNVTIKDVLDAIVTVADHPLEYSLKDYAVVFSAKPEAVAGRQIVLERPGTLSKPGQAYSFIPDLNPMLARQARRPGNTRVVPRKTPRPNVELANVAPQTFNIDFGPAPTTEQVGPAAAGHAGDFWNTVSVGFNDHHTESALKFAGGDPSPIEVEMINLGGSFGGHSAIGDKYPMLDTINYPTGNKGGNSTVILHQVPPGKYSIYLYGYSENPLYWGDYTLTVGTHDYGRKKTLQKKVAEGNTKWIEGSQYVKFSSVMVGEGEEVRVLIRPGPKVTDASGRTFADAMINGLQLIPEGRSRAATTVRPQTFQAGLVSWWKAEGNALDQAGINNGEIQSGASYAAGRVGRAFSFDPASGSVLVPDSSSLQLTDQITIEAWIKTRGVSTDYGIVSKVGGAGGNNGYQFLISGNRLMGQFNSPGEGWPSARVTSGGLIASGVWYHVAWTYDQSAMKLYVNGRLVATEVIGPKPIAVSSSNLRISGDDNLHIYFDGLIDEPSIYNRALSDAEIAAIYKAGSAGKPRPIVAATGHQVPAGRPAGVPTKAGLVSRWRAEGDARDAAGSNHGTLGNGVAFVPGRVGQAFSFNGDHQYVRIAYSPTLIASKYSVEAWVKPTAQVSDPISQDLIFGQGIGTVQLVAQPGATGVRIVFLFGTDKYTFYEVASESEIPIGQFSHLTGTWDGTTLRLYINGALEAESSPGAAPVDSGCDFFIGGFSTSGDGDCNYEGQFFSGLIDETAFYRRALSAAEVQASYKAGSAGKDRSAR